MNSVCRVLLAVLGVTVLTACLKKNTECSDAPNLEVCQARSNANQNENPDAAVITVTNDDVDTTGPVEEPSGPSSCDPACSGTTRVCDLATTTCVQCLKDSDCKNTSPICGLENKTCGPCTDNLQCQARADGKPLCDTFDGACVRCIDDSHCNGTTCNPVTRECSNAAPGSVGICGACLADRDCTESIVVNEMSVEVEVNCVPMEYDGEFRGHYCLLAKKSAVEQDCSVRSGSDGIGDFFAIDTRDAGYGNRPFAKEVVRDTLSGKVAVPHCTFNERFTTCEGFLSAVEADPSCSSRSQCSPDSKGARCTDAKSSQDVCTYRCDDWFFCPGGMTCSFNKDVCS